MNPMAFFNIPAMILFVIVAALVLQIRACGGGSGCCPRAPPPVATCGTGCQQGYQCGTYGCTRRKALSALTARIDGVIVGDESGEQAHTAPVSEKHVVQPVTNVTVDKLMNPNFIFHTCCEARGLPDACLRYCHFNTYTANSLERMFRKEDKCPIEAAHEIHYCAAQGIDHTECCASSGVADTTAGDKCLSFCDQRPNRFTALDVSYLPCYDIFENMKRCFFVAIRKRAQEKFGNEWKSSLSESRNSFTEF